MAAEEIRVRGTVQGVGFRPFIYHLAKVCGLRGEVCNDGEGVVIRASGADKSIEEFIVRLRQECPPLARINEIQRQPYKGEFFFADFVISDSVSSAIKTEISPDAATCVRCLEEIFDPCSRFYRYPFTNCTHCGPRLSIIRALPYDRSFTSMAAFAMCTECAKEYNDVENRRFHAQPIACHSCGPKATLERSDRKPVTASMFSMLDDIDAVCTLLQKGEIVAIKGIGGIHLACDATNETAVQKLRQRKQRYRKPFALMARDIQIIARYCILDEKETELLQSPAAPIVLLKVKKTAAGEKEPGILSPSVAPGYNTLGFMLPYMPLHHLILKRMDRPIVLTSGNLADEPQCIDNEEARKKLGKIADYFLLHDRQIVNRVDDSVVRVIGDRVQTIRRARGYAPAPINLPLGFCNSPSVLAMGGELKNTFCLLRDGQAILSQHLGDLENATAFAAYQETLNLYLNLFEHKPQAIASDRHPEYLSTKLGKQLAATNQIPFFSIQHHHAHIAACMAENGIPLDSPPVLGIALDGLGYGEDGTFWGGEFLLVNYHDFQRLATFKPVPMLGGKQAIKQPWRNTYSQLISGFDWQDLKNKYGELEIIQFLEGKPLSLLNQLISQGINSPLTSAVGRLFDAVAAAIGVCREECSYEGQPAIEMEALVDSKSWNNHQETQNYSFHVSLSDNIYYLDSYPMWQALLRDLQQGFSSAAIAAKFHQSLAENIVKMVNIICRHYPLNKIVLTGGVFQNSILLEQLKNYLQALNFHVLTPSLIPCNDGGLSLGQAVIAAANFHRKRR